MRKLKKHQPTKSQMFNIEIPHFKLSNLSYSRCAGQQDIAMVSWCLSCAKHPWIGSTPLVPLPTLTNPHAPQQPPTPANTTTALPLPLPLDGHASVFYLLIDMQVI